MKNLIKKLFTKTAILPGLLNGALLSAFIFLAWAAQNVENGAKGSNLIYAEPSAVSLVASLAGLALGAFGFYRLLFATRAQWAWSGFFAGLFWFYWMSFSLVYYGFAWLIPAELLGIGAIYGAIFAALGYVRNALWRAFALLAVGFIHPFGFNWLKFELIFVNTPFSPTFYTLAALLFSLALFKFKPHLGLAALALALFFCQKPEIRPNFLPFKIELAGTDIPQSKRWERSERARISNLNTTLINAAISRGARLVALPESAYPLYLDHNVTLVKELLEKSGQIAIVTGGLGWEEGRVYNSAYFFDKGQMRRLDKVVLVPFGEEIPLPTPVKKLINELFFGGASDFAAASKAQSYEIDGVKITNAICYEATRDEIYEANPRFVVAVTNNAWFYPSSEPTLQRLLLKYFSFKYHTTIYHSVNGSKSEIIIP